MRNLLFCLEDRRPFVWSATGQFEIARILFIPGNYSIAFSKLYDDIKTVDSRYRNLLTETNRLVKRLKDQRRAETAKEIDPSGAKRRGLLSLMRRHRHNLKPEQQTRLEAYFEQFPVLREIYRFKQKLCYLLSKKHRTPKQCLPLANRFPQGTSPAQPGRPSPARPTRPNAFLLVGRDRDDVALHPQQRHHRRIPHPNGGPSAASLRLPQFQKLSIKG